MQTLHTERLAIRPFSEDDAPFILVLVNDGDWLRHIGNKGVHTLEDARRYLREGPLAMYARNGHGLCGIERRSDGALLGMCGLLRRDGVDDVDLGYALLPTARGQGYAVEAAAAVLAFGFATLGLQRIVATTSLDNHASGRVLEAVGLHVERVIDGVDGEKSRRLFAIHASVPPR